MKKVLFGCLGAAIVLTGVAALLIWLWLFRELPKLEATVSLPSKVALESTFSMAITANNAHKRPITLDSIDVDDSFLSGVQVERIDPEPTATTHICGQRSWNFGQSVAPGTSMVVRFQLRAVQEGHFSGDIDVCNPNQDFKTLLADVVIKKGLSNKEPEAMR